MTKDYNTKPMPTRPGKTKRDLVPKVHHVTAQIALVKRVTGNEVQYAFKEPVPPVDGMCAGKAENSSCGLNCTCISGQPHYSPEGLAMLGITLMDET